MDPYISLTIHFIDDEWKLCSKCLQTSYFPDRDAIEVELRSYLQALDVDGEADPLEWWKLHQANFSRVASLARKYLCIPATSALSERAFSTGGNIVTGHRAALNPENVDRLVFLAKNLP